MVLYNQYFLLLTKQLKTKCPLTFWFPKEFFFFLLHIGHATTVYFFLKIQSYSEHNIFHTNIKIHLKKQLKHQAGLVDGKK